MRPCAKYFACAMVVAFVFARGAGAQSGETAKTDKKLSIIPIPVGQNAIDIRFPYWGTDGKLKTMLFHAALMERKDLTHIHMTNAKITTFDEHEKADMVLLLPVSVFDLSTHL